MILVVSYNGRVADYHPNLKLLKSECSQTHQQMQFLKSVLPARNYMKTQQKCNFNNKISDGLFIDTLSFQWLSKSKLSPVIPFPVNGLKDVNPPNKYSTWSWHVLVTPVLMCKGELLSPVLWMASCSSLQKGPKLKGQVASHHMPAQNHHMPHWLIHFSNATQAYFSASQHTSDITTDLWTFLQPAVLHGI